MDYIFASQYLTSRLLSAEVKYGFEQSDHASVLVKMCINEDIKVGPGLTRVNSVLLNSPVQLNAVITGLNSVMTKNGQVTEVSLSRDMFM